MEVTDSAVCPPQTPRWPLRHLTAAQYKHWAREGYLAVPAVVPLDLCRAAAATIRTFVGADDARPLDTWYQNELDIYTDTVPGTNQRPKHGPCGMVQMSHHASLWQIRQHPALHDVFADIYGTERLWTTVDRAHFKPPHVDASVSAAWSQGAGPVHTGLHWDTAVDDNKVLPVPFCVQGVVYLEDTTAAMGPLHVVPGSMRNIPNLRRQREQQGPESFADQAVAVEGTAGTLVLWHSGTLHGPGTNRGTRPRVSAYFAMLPVDASPYVGPGRPADFALSMADAGTLQYMDYWKKESLQNDTDDSNPDDPPWPPYLRRKTRLERVELWRHRRFLLEEDPREDELEAYPPDERAAPPFDDLTPLGRKLVGLDEW